MHWKAAAKAYFKPETFRRDLNACIQSARSVTFVLQKHKSIFPDFDSWYSAWQTRMRADPTMRWLVDARNHIEKQGDLETASTMRVTLIDSYIERRPFDADLPVSTKPAEVAAAFMALLSRPEDIPENATLRVERRWVAKTLPDHEILSAMAHALSLLADILADAHRELSIRHAGTEQSGVTKLQRYDGGRSVDIDLSTNERMTLESRFVSLSTKREREAVARYGPPIVFDEDETLEDRARKLMEIAKGVLTKDKIAYPVIFLYKGAAQVTMITHVPRDRREKYLMWRHVADEVRRTGADAVISVAEAWSSKVRPGQTIRQYPADDPERNEIVAVTAESKDGLTLHIYTEFTRDEERNIVLGETREVDQVRTGFLEPIRAAWRSAQ